MDSILYPSWILKCDSNSEKFISYSKDDNLFSVKINTNLLEDGSINYTEIYGYDPSNTANYPLFHIPITVIFPADLFNDKKNYFKTKFNKSLFFSNVLESLNIVVLKLLR